MSEIDFHSIYSDPFVAECCQGYSDGRCKDSPDPSSNRHPAYIHGFINGRDDIGHHHGQTAQQRRDAFHQLRGDT